MRTTLTRWLGLLPIVVTVACSATHEAAASTDSTPFALRKAMRRLEHVHCVAPSGFLPPSRGIPAEFTARVSAVHGDMIAIDRPGGENDGNWPDETQFLVFDVFGPHDLDVDIIGTAVVVGTHRNHRICRFFANKDHPATKPTVGSDVYADFLRSSIYDPNRN